MFDYLKYCGAIYVIKLYLRVLFIEPIARQIADGNVEEIKALQVHIDRIRTAVISPLNDTSGTDPLVTPVLGHLVARLAQ